MGYGNNNNNNNNNICIAPLGRNFRGTERCWQTLNQIRNEMNMNHLTPLDYWHQNPLMQTTLGFITLPKQPTQTHINIQSY